MARSKVTSDLVQELQQSLLPYRPLLGQWLSSGYCFISKNEQSTLASLLAFDSIELLAVEMNVDKQIVEKVAKHIALKLKMNKRFYMQFKADYKAGDLKKNAFLKQSLKAGLPRSLYLKLFFCGNTIAELLANYTVQDLKRVRNFGDKGLIELKALLNKYNCLDLLLESHPER